ncbi:MAG TPA: hypothetical protein VHY21_01430 [Pseudonocardiaceae bacterium]|nr:hypothetical protein [Pseudonocardiaceae bacterium]
MIGRLFWHLGGSRLRCRCGDVLRVRQADPAQLVAGRRFHHVGDA